MTREQVEAIFHVTRELIRKAQACNCPPSKTQFVCVRCDMNGATLVREVKALFGAVTLELYGAAAEQNAKR